MSDFRASGTVCAIILTYKVPSEAVEAHRATHLAWIEQGFADGKLLLSGRQVPLTGGMLLARGAKAEVEPYAKTDPFVLHDLAHLEVIEIATTYAHPQMAPLIA